MTPTTAAGRALLVGLHRLDAVNPVAAHAPINWESIIAATEAEALAADRARLAAAVRGLEPWHNNSTPTPAVSRAAVLALLEGEE